MNHNNQNGIGYNQNYYGNGYNGYSYNNSYNNGYGYNNSYNNGYNNRYNNYQTNQNLSQGAYNSSWNDYVYGLDVKMNNMWNFMVYGNFCNEEIDKLYRKIRYLKEDKEDLVDKIYTFNKQLAILELDNRFMRKKLKANDPAEKSKKRKIESFVEAEKKKKPVDYKAIDEEEVLNNLKDKYSNLKSIKDIINMKTDLSKWDYFLNDKYKKLYDLIPSLEKLDRIVGMKQIKSDVFKMISYFIHGLNEHQELNNIVITGGPGTGKTTVAKILGKIYLSLGFLKNDNFVVARRSDLIGGYLGQTAIKTQKVIDEAEGGVLFIDEVYSLGNKEGRDSFSKECIDTINQGLTEKVLLCIVSGYEEEVYKCFFAYNQGLERRFPIKFKIDKYSEKDLYDIFMLFIREEKWIISNEKHLLKKITDNRDKLTFCGGDIKTLFKYAKENYSLRLMSTSIDLNSGNKSLNKKDINDAMTRLAKGRKKDEMSEHIKTLYV
jgi:SpoVK/Ycf46/Vps4 family AAA+-type ATPase